LFYKLWKAGYIQGVKTRTAIGAATMNSKVKLLHGYSFGQVLPAQMVPLALGLLLTSVVAATSIFLGDLDWLKEHGFRAGLV